MEKFYHLTVIWKTTATKVERQLFHEKHNAIKVKMINPLSSESVFILAPIITKCIL